MINFQRALNLAQRAGEYRLEVDSLNRLAEIEIEKQEGSYERNAQRALNLAERIGYESGQAAALNNLGVVAYVREEQARAIEYFDRALSLWKGQGELGGEAEALTNLGLTYGDSGQVSKAAEYLEQALSKARAAGDPQKEAHVAPRIALVYMTQAEWQKALDLYERTVLLLRQVGDKAGLAIALNGLGSLYDELGEPAQALMSFNESLGLSHRLGHRPRELVTLGHIASILAESDRTHEALRVYRNIIRTARALRKPRVEAYALNDAGGVYESRGDLERARRCYDRAVAIGRSVHHPRVQAYSLAHSASLDQKMGLKTSAQTRYEQALSLMEQAGDPTGEALVLYDMARLKQDQGDIDAALKDTRHLIATTESQRAAVTSPELRTSYFATVHQQYELLIDLLMTKHRLDASSGYDVEAFEASEMGRARRLIELLVEARANVREGVPEELLDKDRAVRHQLAKKAAEEIALRETRFELQSTKSGQNRSDLLRQNLEALDAISREISALTAQSDQVASEIASKASKKYVSLLTIRQTRLKQLQEMLPDDKTLALEYSLGEHRSYLWIVGRSSLTSQVLPGRAIVERQATAFYSALTSISSTEKVHNRASDPARVRSNLSAFNSAREKLSTTLLGPIDGVAGSKRLVIIPDGALEYIPFSSLIEPGSTEPLVARHELVTLPSLSVLSDLRDEIANRVKAPKTLIVIADPVVEAHDPRLTRKRVEQHSSTSVRATSTRRSLSIIGARDPLASAAGSDESMNFVRLPFAAEEAEALAALVPENDRLVATGFAANRQIATSNELGQFRIIHFATHGLLDFRYPRLSCLLLSRFDDAGKPQDGYLRLQDIYNLNLSADLVVLSACQTALGKEVRGEGLLGLTRGFFYAGSPRVVASLWNVDDRASSKLMERFYRKMLGPDKLRPAAALRAAQREMMSEKPWQDPYFWAGFVLQGEWE